MICDFCSTPVPEPRRFETASRRFETLSFEMEFSRSVGDWAACPTCAALVDADDRAALAQRSTDTFFEVHPGAAAVFDRAALLVEMAELHAQFFAHRLRVTV